MNFLEKYSSIDQRNLLERGKEVVGAKNKQQGVTTDLFGKNKNKLQEPQNSNNPTPLPKPQKPKTLDDYYLEWQKQPNKKNLSAVLNKAKPVINSAMTTYVGSDNPAIKGQAKHIAIKAIKSYDPSSKSTLKTWLMTNLKGLKRVSTQATPIKTPERIRIDFNTLEYAAQELTDAKGREPSDEELADHTGIPVKRINYVRSKVVPSITEGQIMSAGERYSEGSSGGFDPATSSTNWEDIWLEYVYTDLDNINKQIFDMRLGRGKWEGKPLPVHEISKKLKLTPAAVSIRTNKIMDKIMDGYEYSDVL